MIKLLPYNDSLADSLAPFVVSFWDTHHSLVDLKQAKNLLNEWMRNEHRLFAIALGDQLVGFLRIHNTSPTLCWIDDIFVDEPHRGKGIATQAIGLLEARMKAEGLTSFCMEVIPDNIPAIRLYHKLGYDRLSMIIMRKDTETFDTQRTETISGLSFRVRRFE